jgi:hypothetical protein
MRHLLGCLSVLTVACGSESSSVRSNEGHDARNTPSCGSADVVIAGRGSVPSVGWMRSAEVSPHAVAVDANGNVFVAGELSPGTDLGGGPLMGNPDTAGIDAFLVSYTVQGKHRWSKRYGGTGIDRFLGMSLDADGNVYATGEFTEGSDLGAGKLTKGEVLVASFDNDGEFRWTTQLGVSRAWDLAVQPDGTTYATGEFGGTAKLGDGSLTSGGGVDGFLASFDPRGAYRWSTAFGGKSNETGYGVATNGSGVALTGTFYEPLTLGTDVASSAGSQDVLVASFDQSGVPRWSRSIGGTSADIAGGIAIDADGVVYAIGSLQVDAVTTGGESGFFLSSFDDAGTDHAKLGSTGQSFAVGTSVTVNKSGNVYVAGRFSGSSDFGGGALQTNGTQAVLASYDSDLGHRWSLGLDWVGPPSGPDGVASGPDRVVYVIGNFSVTRKDAGTAMLERPFLVQFVEGCR